MVVSCIVFEIARDIGRKTPIVHTPIIRPIIIIIIIIIKYIYIAQDREMLQMR